MSDPLGPVDDASKPLSQEEKEDLIPSYTTTRGELNEAEQNNILKAEDWAFRRARSELSTKFLNDLHKRMFGRVWQWAGRFRQTGKNVGVDAYRIPVDLTQLVDDCAYWVEHQTYEPDEIAARFHHRLVFIHPYPNGNGRHGRLATDLLLISLGRKRFSWGSDNLVDVGVTRANYVHALQAADKHDFQPLFEFVRS